MLPKTLSQTIREARKSNKLTLKKLSKKAKLSVSYLSELERGAKENPSAIKLKNLSNALNIPLSELLDSLEKF